MVRLGKRTLDSRRGELSGFTLIELLTVLAIVAALLTLSMPKYFHRIDASKETILRTNLKSAREVIDAFYGDKGRYPDSLQELVDLHYLRELPFDPLTNSTTNWVLETPVPPIKGGVMDIHSSASGSTSSGEPYDSL